jgi:hypothetical protein
MKSSMIAVSVAFDLQRREQTQHLRSTSFGNPA